MLAEVVGDEEAAVAEGLPVAVQMVEFMAKQLRVVEALERRKLWGQVAVVVPPGVEDVEALTKVSAGILEEVVFLLSQPANFRARGRLDMRASSVDRRTTWCATVHSVLLAKPINCYKRCGRSATAFA
jgi:hypothetical protein